MWAAATCQDNCIQSMPYLEAGSGIDPVLEICGSVVDKLVFCLLDQNGSQFYIVMDNFFASVWLLIHLKVKNFLLPAQSEKIGQKRFFARHQSNGENIKRCLQNCSGDK